MHAEFMERMELKYGEAAAEAGVYVVSSCGFDSIPADWGVVLAMQQFKKPAVSLLSVQRSLHASCRLKVLTGTQCKVPAHTYVRVQTLNGRPNSRQAHRDHLSLTDQDSSLIVCVTGTAQVPSRVDMYHTVLPGAAGYKIHYATWCDVVTLYSPEAVIMTSEDSVPQHGAMHQSIVALVCHICCAFVTAIAAALTHHNTRMRQALSCAGHQPAIQLEAAACRGEGRWQGAITGVAIGVCGAPTEAPGGTLLLQPPHRPQMAL